MGHTVRVAGTVAQSSSRFIPGGIGNVAPTTIATGLNNPLIAQGKSGNENCVLTITLRQAALSTTITCYLFDTLLQEWVLAGAASGTNSKTFAPGSKDVFVLPEDSLFFLVGSAAIAAGNIAVDGTNAAGGLP